MVMETAVESEECEVEVKTPTLIGLAKGSAIEGTNADAFKILMSDDKVHTVEGKELEFVAHAMHHGSTVHCFTSDGLAIAVYGNNVVNHKRSGKITPLDIMFCKQELPDPGRMPSRPKFKKPHRKSAQGVRSKARSRSRS